MRPHYTTGGLLLARDLRDEQDYRLERVRRHNRFAHGWGVVCGLQVVPASNRTRPWAVRVCPGYAIDPCGNEIEVPASVAADIHDYLWSRPDTNGVPSRVAFVAVRYSEHEPPGGPGASSCGCGCAGKPGETEAERVGDGFVIDILWQPPIFRAQTVDLCRPNLAPCPLPLNSPYVFLAEVHLPAAPSILLLASSVVGFDSVARGERI